MKEKPLQNFIDTRRKINLSNSYDEIKNIINSYKENVTKYNYNQLGELFNEKNFSEGGEFCVFLENYNNHKNKLAKEGLKELTDPQGVK